MIDATIDPNKPDLGFRDTMDAPIQYITEMSARFIGWGMNIEGDTWIYATVTNCGEEVVYETIQLQSYSPDRDSQERNRQQH